MPSSDSGAPRHLLRHYDRRQLLFQVREIVHERTYLRYGVNVGPGDVVLDVGANVGVAAVFFAADCGAALVHSFEPVAPLYDLLVENTAHYAACLPHRYGLSDSRRNATIAYYPDAAAMSSLYADPIADAVMVRTCLINNGKSPDDAQNAVDGRYDFIELECELRTISDIWSELELDHVDLLKVDVERSELDVLHGVGDANWSDIKQVVAEVHDHHGRLALAGAFLERRGFHIEVVQDEVMRGTNLHMVFARRL
jgi:31-O-methyltransferase